MHETNNFTTLKNVPTLSNLHEKKNDRAHYYSFVFNIEISSSYYLDNLFSTYLCLKIIMRMYIVI